MSIVFFIQIARITSYIEISFGELFKLYSFMLPRVLLFVVPIAFFVSLAMTLFRLSKENESIVEIIKEGWNIPNRIPYASELKISQPSFNYSSTLY